jgi:ribosomal protein L29
MKQKEIFVLPTDELLKRKEDARFELMKLNSQVATGTTPKSPGQIRLLRRTLARIEFVMAQRTKQPAKEAPKEKQESKSAIKKGGKKESHG